MVDYYQKCLRGEQLPQSKLTADSVREARKLHREALQSVRELQEEFSAKGLAKRYGVHYRTMEKALSWETWRHVD